MANCRHFWVNATGRRDKVLSCLSEKYRKMHGANIDDDNSPRSHRLGLQQDLNGAVNMSTSLLPRGSNESVNGGFMDGEAIGAKSLQSVHNTFVTIGNCKIACCHVQALVGNIHKLHREPKVPFHGLNEAFRPVCCQRLPNHVISLGNGD